MTTEPLRINCPKCGSGNIAYSCEPDCCFNHVCGDCLANFQLVTRDLGQRFQNHRAQPVSEDGEESDSCAPTVACAKCHGLSVRSLVDSESDPYRALCSDCGS